VSVGASLPDASLLSLPPSERPELAELAGSIGIELDPRQCEQLLQFADLLRRWNRVYNLTAIEHPSQVISHHLLDSLAIVPTLLDLARGAPARVLDVGTGGGLPGVPLAIAAPKLHVTLLDRVQKKAAFVQQVKSELRLQNIEAVHSRVEDYRGAVFDVIVSRAFSSLADFVRATRHLLATSGHWCAMKGSMPSEEIQELERVSPDVRVTRTVKLRVPRLDAERHLLLLESS